MLRVAFFTGGTIGAGHLVRGLALYRALLRNGVSAEFKMFGPEVRYHAAKSDGYFPVTISREELSDPRSAESSQVARQLIQYQPHLIIVDLFWAPLRYVLSLIHAEAWLLVRKCPVGWFENCSSLSFDPKQFQRVIGIEPIGMSQIREFVDPVMICNPEECKGTGALKEYMGIPHSTPLYVKLDSQSPLLHSFTRENRIVTCHFCSPSPIFPIAEWLTGADGILAAAGYNTFWESRWLGYSDKVVFIPQYRPIDDQAWRVKSCTNYIVKENGADILARAMR